MGQLKELGILSLRLVDWARRNPVHAFLVAAVFGAIVYFFGFAMIYVGGTQPIWTWAWMRFLPQYNQEHSKIIPVIVGFLIWYHREAIAKASKSGSNWGLVWVIAGIIFYVVGARALQPRVALFGLPFLLFGLVLFIWGKQVARILAFPIALLFFMIPLGAIEQMTFRLQFIIIGFVNFMSRLFGIDLHTIGTTIQPASGNWDPPFDIAEGCSGIRSLIAMIMITAVYVHLCEPKFWKKITILSFSIVFAIIGNAGRIFTIIVLAEMGFAKFAGGVYHDWSSQVIFFPIALLSMFGFSKLINIDYRRFLRREKVGRKEVTYAP